MGGSITCACLSRWSRWSTEVGNQVYMEQSTPFPVCLLAKDVMSLHVGMLVTPELSPKQEVLYREDFMNLNCS